MEINNIDNQQRTTGMPVIGLRLLRFESLPTTVEVFGKPLNYFPFHILS